MGKPTECRMTEPPPNSDQIELTLFGPGFGECIAVHFGEGRWIVVDSCIDKKTGNPAVLDYFNRSSWFFGLSGLFLAGSRKNIQ